MTIRRGVLPVVLAVFAGLGSAAAAQPASSSAAASDGAPLVAQDFAFNFDQPAFFELVRRMRVGEALAGATNPPREVSDWREFIERPSDFRGAAVRIRGALVRNKDPFTLRANPELGLLTQLELTGPQLGIAATVICTDDVGDLALGDTLEFVARFVMIRSYYTDSGRVAHAPLFVAAAPLAAERAAPRNSSSASRHLPWIFAAFVLALAAFWVILRRAAKAPIRSSEARLTRIPPPQYPVPGWGNEPPDVIYDTAAAPDAAADQVNADRPSAGEQH